MTSSSPNKIFTNTATHSVKQSVNDKKRKATKQSQEKRRRSKYARLDDTTAARRAYSRHDGGIAPDQVTEDISPYSLEGLKSSFYQTKVVITREDAHKIEQQTRNQEDNEYWKCERRKKLTASTVGGIAKMKETTKRSKNVKIFCIVHLWERGHPLWFGYGRYS